MCIIVVKPKGIEMPDTDTLVNCDLRNPDGSGFMLADGETVRIRKGFMDFAEFAEAFDEETAELDAKETAIVMHFRIATHGDVVPGCCHPFPLTDDEETLLSTSCDCPIGVAHNGVISGMSTNSHRSDTMDYISRILTPLAKMAPDFLYRNEAFELLEATCKSKLAIMDATGHIMLVGDFEESDDGVLYSNGSYKPRKSTVAKSVGMNWGDWDYAPYGYGYGYGYGYEHGRKVCGSLYNTVDDEDDGYDEIAGLIDLLPFHACKYCYMGEECALTAPSCRNEKEAEDAEELYSELWYENEEDGEEDGGTGQLALKIAA